MTTNGTMSAYGGSANGNVGEVAEATHSNNSNDRVVHMRSLPGPVVFAMMNKHLVAEQEHNAAEKEK
jgi:hypothetical protein